MAFIRNEGQWDPSIRFMITNGRGRGWLTDTGFVAQLVEHHHDARPRHPNHAENDDDEWYEGVNVAFTFEGANPSPVIEPQDELPGRYHYFIDRDPAGWHKGVRSFSRVVYRDLYPGIDVEYYEKDEHLEYDLVLRPGANPGRIALRCDGAESLSLSDDGSVRIATAFGDVLHTAPTISNENGKPTASNASCGILLAGRTVIDVKVTGWLGDKTLRIDPGLVYGTYLGGTGTGDLPLAIELDSAAQPVIAGKTESGFPTTPGAFQTNYGGGLGDAFITKLSVDGASLLFSTYLGTATSSEGARDLALLESGDIVVSGNTTSPTFPVTLAAFDVTHNGLNDAWIARLSDSGDSLVFSTFLGGSASDTSALVAIGPTGDIYVAGSTPSVDFPVTSGAFCTTLSASGDTYIARLTADGSTMVFGTYGGTAGAPVQSTSAAGLAVDSRGNAYIAGLSSGTGLPVTAGAFDLTHNGEADAFVMRLDSLGASVDYCTYFGGTGWESARGLRVDASGSAYLMGMTDSFNLPVTPGAYSTSLLGSDCPYVAKFSPDGSFLEYCTYAGGNCFNDPYAFGLDDTGCTYVGGLTCQSFPTTPDAIKHGIPGKPTDGFLLRLDPEGASLAYATLIGGDVGTFTPSETVRALTLDGQGGVYLVGETYSSDFPATAGAFDTQMAGSEDGFVIKLDLGAWTSVGHALSGTGGLAPFLAGGGSLQPGSSGSLTLYDAKPQSPATLIVGLAPLDVPFKGGIMVPNPLLLLPLATNASGGLALSWLSWPSGLPGGTELRLQYWIVDAGAPAGLSASNGLLGVTPEL